MEKRPRKTPAEKARAQYTNYAVRDDNYHKQKHQSRY